MVEQRRIRVLGAVLGLAVAGGAGAEEAWKLTFVGRDDAGHFAEVSGSTALMEAFRARYGAATPALEGLRVFKKQNGGTYLMSDGKTYQKVLDFRVEGQEVRVFRNRLGELAFGTQHRPSEWLLAQHRGYAQARAAGLSPGSAKVVQAFAARVHAQGQGARDAAVARVIAGLKARRMDQWVVDPEATETWDEYRAALRDRERLRRFQGRLDEIPASSWALWESSRAAALADPALAILDEVAPVSEEQLDRLDEAYREGEEPEAYDEVSYQAPAAPGADLFGFGGLAGGEL